jgi:tetratricopeptide (TPR) repeat protein
MNTDNCSTNGGNREPTPPEWDWIDLRVKLFERNWAAGAPSRLTQYLGDAGALRQPLLVELVHTDLEFAYRHDQKPALDGYLCQFPELAVQSEAVAKLILRELELRRVHQPSLTLDELLTSYPSLHAAFKNSLPTIRATCDPGSSNDSSQAETGSPAQGSLEEIAFPELPGYVFRREAETVAALQHPQVLQVYHIGEYKGQPYLVLEFAPGGNLSRMLGGRPLEATQAAKLMHGLAQAVAAAHHKGIVHRDLKPGNVLIDSQGLMKIADFGLAKRLTVEAGNTEDDLLTCTPSYAAPESIFEPDRPVAPAVDIYSLGAILFELLTGRPPFVGTSILEVLDQARIGDTVAPRRLVSSVPRDLETICLKCLERDPAKRYATAADLAGDLDRFLNGKPVLARPITAPVRFARWVRRKPAMAAMSVALIALLVGITASSLGLAVVLAKSSRVEREWRMQAEQALQLTENSERVAWAETEAARQSISLIQELFAATDFVELIPDHRDPSPEQHVVRIPTRQLLELTIARLDNTLKHHPLARARLLTTVGVTAVNVGMLIDAGPILKEALELYRASGQGETVLAAETLIALAQIEAFNREFDPAAELYAQSAVLLRDLSLGDSLLQAKLGVSRVWLGLTCKRHNYVAKCLSESERAVEIRRSHLGEQHPQTILAQAIHTLARAAATQDRTHSLQAMESLWHTMKDAPVGNFLKGIVLNQLASFHQRLGNSEHATSYINASLERMNLALGKHDHPIHADILSDAAWIAHCRGDIRSTRLYREMALRMFERCAGESQKTLDLRIRLIVDLQDVGEHTNAKVLAQESHQVAPANCCGHFDVDEFLRQKRYAEARTTQKSILAGFEATGGAADIEFHSYKLAGIEVELGNYTEALAIYDRWLERAQSFPAPDGFARSMFLPWDEVLARCSDHQRAEEHRAQRRQKLDAYRDDLPHFHPDDWSAIYDLILRIGKTTSEADLLVRWHAGWLSQSHPRHVCMGALKYSLALHSMATGDLERAREQAAESVSILTESLGDLADRKIWAEFLLTRVRIACGDGADALIPLEASLAKYHSANGEDHPIYLEMQAELDELTATIE